LILQLQSTCPNGESTPGASRTPSRHRDAMMRGDGIVSGWKNKLTTVMASATPAGMLAEQHRKMAEPGSGTK
jgi:hypothetical protein